MLLQINFKSGKPIYLQLVDQVKAAAASGALQAGEELPVNRNTVAKAYSELENLGIVETQPGRGCFLKSNNGALRKDARRKLLITEIDQALVQAHHLQVPREELLELIQERLEALEEKRRVNKETKNEEA